MFNNNKLLGQHFLIDKNIINKIITVVNLKYQNIIEIGGGTGHLSEYIKLYNPASFLIIELDPICVNILRQKQFNVLEIDCLQYQYNTDIIIGNLPYYISKDIILSIIMKGIYKHIIIMVQKEVGNQLMGNTNFGTFIKIFHNISKVCDVSPKCFNPKPKVESMVIHIEKINSLINATYNMKSIWNKINVLYNNKNQKLRNKLKLLNIKCDDSILDKRIGDIDLDMIKSWVI